MISTLKLFAMALLLALTIPSVANSKPLNTPLNLAARLKMAENQPSNCWESLFHLQSCTGEIIMFFLNGETLLGPTCCEAITIIQHDCWPDLMGSLGFTPEEGDILDDYCEETDQTDLPTPPPPPPPPPPADEPTVFVNTRKLGP